MLLLCNKRAPSSVALSANDWPRWVKTGAQMLCRAFQNLIPPQEVQKEIVFEMEGYQKVIDGGVLLIAKDGANLVARSAPIASSVSVKCWVDNHTHDLRLSNLATQKFVEYRLNSISFEVFVAGVALPIPNQEALKRLLNKIPGDVATQRATLAEIEAEQELVNASRKPIEGMDEEVQATRV